MMNINKLLEKALEGLKLKYFLMSIVIPDSEMRAEAAQICGNLIASSLAD